jgi:Flp pilus assembly protein TadG
MLLLAGMIDFGMGLYSNMTIINAAREGARLGVTSKNSTTVTSRVQAMATGLNSSDLHVSVMCYHSGALEATFFDGTLQGSGTCSWAADDDVEVKADYTYRMIWPLTFGTQIAFSSSVKMRIE